MQDSSTGIYYVLCDISFPEVPNLFWKIGGKKWGVPVEDLVWRESVEEGKEGMCISAVQVRLAWWAFGSQGGS